MHPTLVRIASSCCALRVRGARDEVRLACARVSALHRDRRQFRGSIGSDGFGKVLIGTRGARETFLQGRKGRAAKNSVLSSGAKLTRACVPRTVNIHLDSNWRKEKYIHHIDCLHVLPKNFVSLELSTFLHMVKMSLLRRHIQLCSH